MENENQGDLERLVLAHVQQSNYRAAKPGAIARQLKLPEEQHRDLKKTIKRLVKKGQLKYASNHLVLPMAAGDSKPSQKSTPTAEGVTGIFRRASGGFGFVRPAGTARSSGKTQDVFIPQRKTMDAANGDTVLVRMSNERQRGGEMRTSGEIVEVLERDTHRFVGTYFERAAVGYVQVDGTVFAQPICVGDPGAKSARHADKVVIELVRFPSHMHEGEGVIVEVLGARGEPGVDTLGIIREYNLPEEFSEEVLDVARQQADRFDESLAGRLDLTGTTVITIDPVDARDFDDAISLERLDNGHWRLGVHIADVSYFVPEKTLLDDEARDRATSVYLPDRVIPMLPEIISNNLASLQPERVRYTKSAFIEMTEDGARVATDVHNAAIRSDRRFTYEEVDEYLSDPKPWREKLTPEVFDLLGRMHELAMILRRRRLDHGAIELTLPEVKIDLDKNGRVAGAHLVENTVSHQIIEEFMLAANEAVAQMLTDAELYFLRRIHESPSPKKLKSLTEFVRELGIECESLESRFEIKRVIEVVADRPERHAVNYAVLRSMQKAIYSPVEEGHYALASDQYCHFTSPIRRYPDLVIHRMLDSLLSDQRPPNDFEHLSLLGQHCSEREQRAEGAERELIKVKLLDYLSKRIGEQMDAVITGVEDFGLFAQGVKLPAEGMIHVSSLQDDYYDYDSRSHSLTGKRAGNSYRLGDVIRVEIFHVDIDRRVLDLRLVSRLKEAPAAPKPKHEDRSPKGKQRDKKKDKGKGARSRGKK
jgi:ribonuclease R